MNCQRGKGCEYWDDGWQRDCCFLCKHQSECLTKPGKELAAMYEMCPCFNHKQFRKCREGK